MLGRSRRHVAHARPLRPARRRRRVGAWLLATLLVAVAATAAVAGSAALRTSDAPGRTGGPVASDFGAAVGAEESMPVGPLGLTGIPAGSPATGPWPSITPPARLSGYQWPLEHARITSALAPSNLGVVLVNGVRFHDGIDIASFCGDQIRAAHDGVVLAAGRHVEQWVGWVGDLDAYRARLDAKNLWPSRAIVVVIDDGNGYRSVYMHFSRVVVKAGQVVTAGELIGYEGATGYATGCHLHYAIFDPDDSRLFETRPDLVKSQSLPAAEIARIDPLLVLPPPESAFLTWAWGSR